MFKAALFVVVMCCFGIQAAFAQPRVWIADQGNNQQGPSNPNNRILEIDPFNKKTPPDAQGDVIVLRTLPSPAAAFLDELVFDDQERLWCVVKNTQDQAQDGATRIDKETGAIQTQIFPFIPGHVHGSYLEGIAWDGAGLWITGVRDFSGPNGNVLTRIDPATGNRIAPFDSGPLGVAGRVSIPGNIAQGLLYDPSGAGFLWHSDYELRKIYKLDIARLYDADSSNDNNLVVAEFTVPFGPKGMDWMGGKIWVASPRDGIYEFNPATGATQKLFSTPQWNLDGLAVLPEPAGPKIAATPAAIERSVWIGGSLSESTLEVSNGGIGTLEYTLSENADWLTLAPVSGSSTGEADPITLTYDVAGLKAGVYPAAITITAPEAFNSPLTVNVTVTIETVKPDLDGDGDVDQEDFGLFQVCYTGPGGTPAAGCVKASFDGDQDVDVIDFGIFQRCLTRPNTPATPGCEELD